MEIKFNCLNPECRWTVEANAAEAGRLVHCPGCGQSIQVPDSVPKSGLAPFATVGSHSAGDNLATPLARQVGRLLLGWSTGAVLFGLILGALYFHTWAALPRHLDAKLDEVYYSGEFRDAPVANRAGTALLYAQDVPAGISIFLLNLATLERNRLETVGTADMARVRAFKLCGWSPDDHCLAFAVSEADGEDRRVVLCDGATGKAKYSFDVGDSVEQGAWLATNCLILLDHSRNLYVYYAESETNLVVGGKGPVKLRQLGGDDPTFSLVPASDHSIAYIDGGNIWTLDISNNQPLQLTHFNGATLEWLDYGEAHGQYLFCCRSPATEGSRYLYKFNSQAGRDAQLTLLVTNNTLKGRWLQDGSGYAWVGTGPRGDFLAVETKETSLKTNLFNWSMDGDHGDMRAYGISPKRDKLYAIGAVYSAYGDSIWEYDILARTLRNVTPGLHPVVYSRQIVPIQAWTTNSNGERVEYFYVPPVGLDPHKRYPMVMIQYSWGRYDQNAQAMANAGIFCVAQNRYGKDYLYRPFSPELKDTVAVYRDMLRNPNVDPHRVYICGESASTSAACQLVEMYPSLWSGIVLLSPTSFPNFTTGSNGCRSIFISEGDEEDLALQAYCERTMQKADSHLMRSELAFGHAGHVFSSTQQLKQRYQALVEFILTDF